MSKEASQTASAFDRPLIDRLDALSVKVDHLSSDIARIKTDLASVKSGVARLKTQGESIVATQAELTASLNAVNAKLTKIGTETAALLAAIVDLRGQLANAPVSAELQAAVDAVAAHAQAVDDLVPDV